MLAQTSALADEDDLPAEWRWSCVGMHYKFKNGLNKAKRFFGHGTPIINYMDVYRHPWLLSSHVNGKVSVTKEERQSYSAVKGDAFFTRTSETVSEVGLCSVLMEQVENAVFSGFVLRARPFNSELLPGFAAYALRGSRVRKQIESTATYTTRALTNGRSLSKVSFALPPEAEQRHIASVLRTIDDLIASIDAIVEKKRDLKRAVMQQLLTGSTRLPGFHGEWEGVILNDVVQQKVTYGIVKAGRFQHDGVRMLRGGDIGDGAIIGDPPYVTEEKSREFSRTILKSGDVVVALVGYPGEAAVVPDWLHGANISRAVGLIRPAAKLSSRFLAHYLNSAEGRKAFLRPSAGSAQIVVNLRDLNNLPLSLPHFDEQEEIANIIDDISTDLRACEAKRAKLGAIKQGMMQQLLTGQLRLA